MESNEKSQVISTKACPRCGALVFEDMDVCYACLYRFDSRKDANPGLADGADLSPGAGDAMGAVVGERIPWTDADVWGQLDEPDGLGPHAPAASSSPDETTSLRRVADSQVAIGAGAVFLAGHPRLALEVRGGELTFRLDLPREGIRVGRASDNDVVILNRYVSRRHVAIVPADGGAVVEDLGATNPAVIAGVSVAERGMMRPGDILDVCGTTMSLVNL